MSLSLFKAIDAIIPLLIIPYLIKVVGEENYGIYAFAYALIFYFMNIVQYGFTLSGVRIIALNRADNLKLNESYNNIFTTQLYLTLFVLTVLTVLILTIDTFRVHYQIYLFFLILIIGEFLTPFWFFLGIEKMRFITIINLLSKSSFAVLTFFLVNSKSDYVFISLYQSIGFLVSGLFAQFIIIYSFKIKFKIAPIKNVIETLKEGFSSFLTLITPTIYSNTSIFLIGIFGAPQYVSYMQIGTKVSGAFSVLNTILTSVFYPIINRKKYLFKRIRYIFLSIGLALSFIMYFFSDILLRLWLPGNPVEIIQTVKLLSPTPFLASVISCYGVNYLMVLNKDQLYMRIVLIGSVTGLILGLILIPKYYYVGGAICIVSARGIKALLSFYYSYKLSKSNKNEI
ncbi:oligosaccharide flippase family protein [Formosa undariae]|uniref:Oligosaccharide flippase family protein n=1 Tax=Formosa undariae TaxID=1325436 RepID=A0ABV5F070_9FLAO